MDRNTDPINLSDIPPVALRKESVDRNFGIGGTNPAPFESLSARRAWIEIVIILANIMAAV